MRHVKRGERDVAARTVVQQEGEESRHLYTVLRGMGLRYKTVGNGMRQVIGFPLPGDLVGLQGGMMGPMGHSFMSVTAMTLCVFDRADLREVFVAQPERAFDLTWLAATEENVLGEMLASVGQRSAMQSMAWLLARLYGRGAALGMASAEGAISGVMPFPYRQQDVADALGLSLVHTNKTLAKLRVRGLAAWSDGLLRLPDLPALGRLAGTDPLRIAVVARPLF